MLTLGFELKTLARLSLPVALSQLGMTAMGAIDTLLLGHVGVDELAAAALGNVWEWTWLCLGFGLVLGIESMISQAHGRGDGAGAALALQRGIVVALLASVPICAALFWTRAGLSLLGQDPHLSELAGRYNAYKLPVIPCYMIYAALRQYLQGRTLMLPPTVVMWVGNGVHLVLSSVLIYGWAGLPALGIEGAAMAESITFVLLVLGLSLWIRVFRLHTGAWQPWSRDSFRGLARVVRLGAPVSLQIAFEAWAFSIAALMAGWIDRDAVGSHQIALSLAVFSFMIPLGVAQGAATRVGNLIGAGDGRQLRRAIGAALLLGAAVMVVPALVLLTLRRELPALYSVDSGVIALAARLLPIAAAFQLFDGLQAVAGGILRGMGRPDAGAALSLVCYYVIALPLGYVLGFVAELGLTGIWIALALGLVILAVTLLCEVRRCASFPVAQLQLGVERSEPGFLAADDISGAARNASVA
jgi:MATE family multidrug resistance protein